MKHIVISLIVLMAVMMDAHAEDAVHPSWSIRYTLDGPKDGPDVHITAVTIADAMTGKDIQHIVLPDPLPYRGEASPFSDVNFDGYDDFSLFAESFAGANTRSDFWIYDPQAKKFRYHSALSELTSVQIDPKTHSIVSENSCCAGSQRG